MEALIGLLRPLLATDIIRRIKIKTITAYQNTIFVGMDTYSGYTSSNVGISWNYFSTSGIPKSFFVVSPSTILVATSNGIQRSTNNEGYWNTVSNTATNCFIALSGVLFAGTVNGVYFSTNQGQSWAPRALPGLNVISLNVSESSLYAGTLRSSSGQPFVCL
ncbi:MAG: hypothetical protein ACP5P3_00960 [Ignavibacteria bacterium]